MKVPHDVQKVFKQRVFWLAQVSPQMTRDEMEAAAWSGIKEDMAKDRSTVIALVTGKSWEKQVVDLIRQAAEKVAEANLIIKNNTK